MRDLSLHNCSNNCVQFKNIIAKKEGNFLLDEELEFRFAVQLGSVKRASYEIHGSQEIAIHERIVVRPGVMLLPWDPVVKPSYTLHPKVGSRRALLDLLETDYASRLTIG